MLISSLVFTPKKNPKKWKSFMAITRTLWNFSNIGGKMARQLMG
jgi:hypothetical protein